MAVERAVRRRGVSKRHFVDFYLGAVHYAVPIGVVREIMNPLPITPLPNPQQGVLGIASIRDEVVPVIDLRRRLGSARDEALRVREKWLLLRIDSRTIATPIDRIGHVFGETAAMEPPPHVDGREQQWIAGVVRHEGAMVLVLQVDRLINGDSELPQLP